MDYIKCYGCGIICAVEDRSIPKCENCLEKEWSIVKKEINENEFADLNDIVRIINEKYANQGIKISVRQILEYEKRGYLIISADGISEGNEETKEKAEEKKSVDDANKRKQMLMQELQGIKKELSTNPRSSIVDDQQKRGGFFTRG